MLVRIVMSSATEKESNLEALRTRLKETIGPVLFRDLKAHLIRGAVFIVAEGTPLEVCAAAIAADDVGQVKAFLEADVLRKPTAAELGEWEALSVHPGRIWQALVVQPYVLVQ